jgi:hypothetical protein
MAVDAQQSACVLTQILLPLEPKLPILAVVLISVVQGAFRKENIS